MVPETDGGIQALSQQFHLLVSYKIIVIGDIGYEKQSSFLAVSMVQGTSQNVLPEFQCFFLSRELVPEKSMPFMCVGGDDVIYTHVMRDMANAPRSPLETLLDTRQ
jgi:hypothetical protein